MSRVATLFIPLFLSLEPSSGSSPTVAVGEWLRLELERHQRLLSEALAAHSAAGKPLHELDYDWDGELQRAQTRITAATGSARREAFYAYLDLGYGAYGADLDPRIVEDALAVIPPDSPLWSLEPYLLESVVLFCDRSLAVDYVSRVISNHPDPEVRSVVATRVDPERRVAPGQPVPAFSFTGLDEPQASYSNQTLLGTPYLIDFWGTWCAPCLAEMSGLHAEKARFEEYGFEILSIALDDPQTVETFRQEQWTMPWLHAIATDGLEDPRLAPFQISGLPMPILVDDRGVIAAVGLPLRGPRLHRTLQKYFSSDE